MFTDSCRRLRIMKGSEAIGLGMFYHTKCDGLIPLFINILQMFWCNDLVASTSCFVNYTGQLAGWAFTPLFSNEMPISFGDHLIFPILTIGRAGFPSCREFVTHPQLLLYDRVVLSVVIIRYSLAFKCLHNYFLQPQEPWRSAKVVTSMVCSLDGSNPLCKR